MRQGHLFVFSKSVISGKSKWSGTWFQYFSIALNLAYNKSKLYKTVDYWSRDILTFDFLEKDQGIVSPPHFVYDFSRKMFLVLYSINWANFIVWLSLVLEILGSMCNQDVFLHDQKFKLKPEISWEWKEYLRWNKKHFSSFL